MKKYTTSQRLKQIMLDRQLRQVDILDLAKPYCEKYNIKLTKTDLSQYVSGKTEPGYDKLHMLASALRINPSWLRGHDVPIENPVKLMGSVEIALGDKKAIANNISYYMNIKSVSIEQLCNELNFDYIIVNKWISAEKHPDMDSIEKMATYFGVTVLDLIKRREAASHDTTDEPLTEREENLVNCFRELDEHGKALVETVAESEYKRCTAADDEGILIAARNGGAPRRIPLKKRKGADSILDQPDDKGGRR